MTIKGGSVVVHGLVEKVFIDKESKKEVPYCGFDVENDDDDRQRYMYLGCDRAVFDSFKKSFVADKVYRFDIRINQFGSKVTKKVVKVY